MNTQHQEDLKLASARAHESRGLSPEIGILLLACAAVLAFLALPSRGNTGPKGPIQGAVRDAMGGPCADVPVLLFQGAGRAPIEVTRTDDHGRFAFRAAYPVFHVLALPKTETGKCPSWAMDLSEKADRYVPIVLAPGTPTAVKVETETGSPLAGAELVVFPLEAAQPPLATQIARTDRSGHASVLVPPRGAVSVRAKGYVPTVIRPDSSKSARVALEPAR